MTSLDRCYQIIQKPVITEKATDDQGRRNAYHFQVPVNANKVEIRKAVERLFSVKVKGVNTARSHAKGLRRGWIQGHTQIHKRAMVTLAEGQTIEIL